MKLLKKKNLLEEKKPFTSRIDVEVPKFLKKVSKTIYPLIEVLTDGNAVKLTGFTED